VSPRNLIATRGQRVTFAALACVVIAGLICVGLTACGGSSSSSQGKLAKDNTCSWSEGVVVSSTGTGNATPGMSSKRLATALKVCGVRGGTFSGAEKSGPTSSAKRIVVERELLKQVACLQERGFRVTAAKSVEQQLFNANGVNTKSVRFRAANRECRERVVEAIRKLGPSYELDDARRAATKRRATPTPQRFRSRVIARIVACLHTAGVDIPPGDSDLLSSTSGIKTRSSQVKAAISRCRSDSLTSAFR
jgi:hypothetical protein